MALLRVFLLAAFLGLCLADTKKSYDGWVHDWDGKSPIVSSLFYLAHNGLNNLFHFSSHKYCYFEKG